MIFKSSVIITFLVSILTLGSFYSGVDNKEREGLILYAMLNYLEQVHFDPIPIDDDFSKKVFENYLKYMDGGKRYFVKEDIDAMKKYELSIDNQTQERTFEFFDMSLELLDVGINRAKGYYQSAIESDFDFSVDEYLEMDYKKVSYATTKAELKERWRKIIKYDVLTRLEGKIADQDDAESPKLIEELKKEAIETTKDIYDAWFKRIDQLRRSDRFEAYLNAMTHLYDPHSDYLSPKDKEDFDIRMGGKLEGIGARLTTDGDYTKVMEIVPGGPAWKGKDLKVDDKIVRVTQKDEEGVDVTGMRLDDVVQKIRGDKGTRVILTVKDDEGLRDVEIERDVVQLEETFAKSLILRKDDDEKIGYIKLPKFYSSFEKEDGNSCAADVARELEKLKDQNVDGIILDLRSNGGGSLRDVVDMSGLFIESGPIVQVKSRQDQPYIYKDKDAGVKYDGPLLVMVNSYSASASEILAAALQDYDRAVIVGSNSTYGKGTVQRIFDLDRGIKGNETLKPLGSVKLTMQKFYRINGGSTQLKGVKPDIILPDNHYYIEAGEKEYDGAMEWSEIASLPFSQEVFRVNNDEEIRDNSEERVESNGTFNLILDNASRIKELRENTSYPLSLEAFAALAKSRDEEAEKYKDLFKDPVPGLRAENIYVDLSTINIDTSRIELNKDWLEGVHSDVYIAECIDILKDININQ